jgi:hypothetical protein
MLRLEVDRVLEGCPEETRMNVGTYKDALLRKKADLMAGGGLRPIQTSMENNNTRQGDLADQASGNNEVHIQLKPTPKS